MQQPLIVPATLRTAPAALCCALVVCLAPAPAAAQFVCQSTGGGADGAVATGPATVVCGTNAGQGANAANSGNTAFGAASGFEVSGNVNTAVGGSAGFRVTGTGNSATGAGAGSNVNGSGNSALGRDAGSILTGDNNVAIGIGAGSGTFTPPRPGGGGLSPLVVSNTVAIGNTAIARADGGVAIGNQSQTNGTNSVAVGAHANAGHENSAAFGNGATTTRANQQVFGTTSNTYTMSGIASSASRAVQSGPVQVVTSDSGGNLATASLSDLGLASMGDIANINSRIEDLTARSNKAFTGVAMAFAMAGVPTLLPSETFAATMNWGTFQGANGLALNAAVRVGPNVQVNGGVGYGPDERIAGGRVGLRVGW
jgi:hypothetical protein